MKFYLKYITYASKRPWLLILLTVIVLAAGLPISKIKIANRPEDWYPEDSRQLPDKNEFEGYFGNDEVMVLYLTFPKDSSDDYKLDQLYSASENIRKIHGFDQVFSRLNLASLTDLMGEEYVKKMEDIYFKSANPNGEAMFLRVRINKDPDLNRPLLLDSLKTLVYPKIPAIIKKDLTGAGVIFTEINELSTKDSKWLFSACYGLIFLLLWWRLRKAKYLLICSVIVLLALWPSMSLFGWFNIPVNMITLIVPLLFIINFFSFAMHLVTKQSADVNKYLSKKIPPIITSALTNIIGFGSLMLSNIKVIYQFGLLTSLGIIIGLVVIFLIGTPWVIRTIEVNRNVEKLDWMNKMLDGFYAKLNKRLAWVVMGIMLLWMGAGIFIFPHITVDTDTVGFIKPDNKTRISKDYIEQNYGSVNIIDFMVDKEDGKPFTKDDWKTIARVRKQLYTLPYIKSAVAYDVWKPLLDELKYSSPKDAENISAGFLSKDKLHSRITIQIPSGSVKEMEKMINTAQEKITEALGTDKTTGKITITARSVGYLPAYIEQMNVIVDEMLESLFVAVILILLVMSVFVRDLKLGLLATFATIFPLCAVALLMKFMDIPFDIATSVIFSVVVGMIADDVLHVIWSFKNNLHLRKNYSINVLFADSVRVIIHPCTATTIMFAIGFAVLLSSDIVFIIDFGILSTSAIIFAWVSDFIFFPALLRLFYSDKQKK
ncbi:MAG: MMPL family transporter [Bacteroidetes bacterium]|nr:MMPL family transporter [Bacteroidota bacterium]